MMKVLAIANQKGGTGKTTTAINLCGCLSKLDNRVLLIDMDPEGHATCGLNYGKFQFDKSIYDVIVRRNPIDTARFNLLPQFDLLPSTPILRELDHKGRDENLAEALYRVNEQYDFVVLDCPPNLGLLTHEALKVSNVIIITVEASFFALKGVANLLETVSKIEFLHRPSICALITMYDRRTKFAREILADANSFFKDKLLNTVIHRNVKLQEATSFGVPITEYDTKCRGYYDYMALAKEVCQLYPGTRDERIRYRLF